MAYIIVHIIHIKDMRGKWPELKIDCDCRKPKPGMLYKAAKDFNIDLSKSYMVGDSENDIKAGTLAGCKTVLVGMTQHDMYDYGETDKLDSLFEFANKYF